MFKTRILLPNIKPSSSYYNDIPVKCILCIICTYTKKKTPTCNEQGYKNCIIVC